MIPLSTGADGYSFLHAATNSWTAGLVEAAETQAHHRLRGGVREETIRASKNDYGMSHAPVRSFFGNWCTWHAVALAHSIGLWLRTLTLPTDYRRTRGRQTPAGRVPQRSARLVHHSRRLHLPTEIDAKSRPA